MTADALHDAGLAPTLPEIEYFPSPLQLFQFSAATGNAHRIHYDEAYARSEGHDGVVVHSTLRGQQLLNVLLRWLGDRGEVRAFAWRNLRPAHAGGRARCRGRVMNIDHRDGVLFVTVELEELNAQGERTALGTATARI